MKNRNQFIKYGAAVPFLGFVGSTFAAVPTEVTTALSDAKADGIAVGVAVLVAIVAIYALKLARKAL